MSSPWDIVAQRARERLGEPGPDAVLGQSVLPVLGDNPDEVAAARDLSKRSGLPLPVVQADRARAQREAMLRELDLPSLGQRAPATAEVLRDRELARVAHDDVRNMALLERYVRDIGQRFERGQRINELGPLGSDALFEALTGGQTDESREFRIRQLQGQQAAETDFGVDPGGVLGFFAGIPGAVAEALPMMGSGVVASAEGGAVGAAGGAAVGAAIGTLAGPGGAAAGAVAGAGEGYATGASLGLYIHSAKMEAGHSFLELRGITDENGQPIDQRVAAGLSLAVGATAGAVEMFALGKLLEKVPGVDRLTGAGWRAAAKKAVSNPSFRQFATGLAFSASGSAATEGLTEGVQELIAIGGELAGLTVTGKGLDDFRFEAPGPDGQPIELRGTDAVLARVLSATSQGAQMGAGVAASGHTARLVTDSERARATIARLPGLERLQRTVDTSKLRERDPEAFKRHVREVASQSGVEAVYIEPQAFREYFESVAPEEAEALFEEIPALREQQEEIARTGADVRLRLEDWLSHPEMAVALKDHVRLDPLEMTAKEALGFQDELEREVGTVQEVVEGARDEGAVRKAVAGEIRGQLLKVYPETVATPLVELTMARMEARAQRSGKTLQQLVEEEGVFRIQGPQEGAPEAQGALPPTLESRLDRLRDEGAVREVLRDLRTGRTPETKSMSQRPLLELLRDTGGVDPEGEIGVQLRELGIRPRGKGAIKGLFVKGGRGAADNIVAEEFPLLQELADPATGYVDPRLLERALSNEIAGTPLRTQEEGAAIAEAEQMRAAVREAIEAAGLTLEADDEALVTAVLDAATTPTREFDQPAFHGTPHRFDRFDITKIGTGEGAQVYGWGLYFSSERGIAEFYRSGLSQRTLGFRGIELRPTDFTIAAISERLGIDPELASTVNEVLTAFKSLGMDGTPSDGGIADAIALAKRKAVHLREVARIQGDQSRVAGYDERISRLDALDHSDFTLKRSGQTVEAEIPDDENLLDWNKPLSEQHPAVREKLEPFLDEWLDNANNPDGAQRTMRSWVDAIVNGTLTGEQIYKGLTRGGRDEVASKRLLEAGILGHRYKADQITKSGKGDATNFVIYDDKAIRIARTFYEANRGAIRMTDDLADVVIRFTEAADLSTFLHESGHLYLAQLAKDAAADEGQLEADLETVKDWARERVGTDDVNSDAVQELWARSFEAYLFEGKAPTLALERVFARFSAWLIRIYKRLRGIPGYENSLTPEIRGVMDRLLATDEQIAEAAEARGLQEMDASALGMTEAQAAEYHRAVSDAKDEAKRRLLPQLMEQARRQATKEWKELRESVRKEVEADVNSRPVFQAQHWLRNGKPLEGAPTPIVPHAKLDREALVELYGKEITKVLPGLYQKEGGLHPDVVAEIFGFPNGDDMVRSLAAAGRRQDVIAQETEAETLRRHGKPETRDDVEAKALEALANQKQLKALLLAERAAATKAGGKVIPLNVAKASAERIVRATRYRDLQPHRFRAAALKAGREAVKLIAKGDYPEAQRAIRLQINNLLMESEARRAIAEADRGLDYLHRVQSADRWARIGKAGHDYQEQIEGLLSRFNLRRNQSLRRIDKLHGLASWIAEQEANGETVLVPPKLRDEAFRTSWKELSIEDMLALRDSVRNLEHMARRKNEFLANRDRRQREAVQADLVAAVDANGKPSNPRLSLTPTEIETWKSWLHTAEGALVKMEFLIDLLDGGDPQGQWRRNVFTPIAEAQAARLDLSKEYTEKLARSMDTLLKGQSRAYTTQWYEPTLGVRMNKMNLLALALNVGNEGNLHRLTDAKGNGWSEQAIMSVLDQRMTESDWAFVRETWSLIDSLWPRIAEQERRLTGVVPEKVQGRTVRTAFGEFEGGYFPIVYDPHRSQFAYKIADKGLYEGLENHFQRAITGHGHTIERTNVAGPLLLDLAVIPGHLDQVIHDITHREVLMQVDKLLQSEQIRAAFKRTNFGDEWFQLFRPWLQGIAKDRIVENRALRGFSRMLAAARSATTTFTLGFRATTLLMQTTGHSNAVGILRERLPNWRQHYVSGMRKALGGLSPRQMQATYEGVLEASGEMRHRISNLDRDLRDVIRRNQGKVTGPARARRAAMELIGKMQMFSVDLPVWLASYEGAQAELGYTHEQAVEFADSVVRMSQGAAGAKDLSAIQRADEGYKQFTLFYSYMNTVYNQVALFSGRRVKNIRDVPAFLASYGYFILLPALGAALIRDALGSNALPEEGSDEGDWFAWFVGLGLSELASMVPFVRDVLPPLIRQVTDGGRYFSGETPVQRAGEAVSDLVVPKDAIDFMFDMARIGSLAAGLPADDVLKRAEKAIRGEE